MKNFNLENYERIIKSGDKAVIFFTSPSCHLCEKLKPVILKLEKKYGHVFNFYSANVSTEKELASVILKNEGVPTAFILSSGSLFKVKDPDDPDDKTWYTFEYLSKVIEKNLKEK